MSYLDLLESENATSQYLIVMRPRRVLGEWALITGTIYAQTFEYGQITKILKDGVELTENVDWGYDGENFSSILIDIGEDPNPYQMVATYELYFGTFDAFWHRSPLDDTSRTVYYEPLVTQSPAITSSQSDVFFGFLPTFSAQVSISNATSYLQKHIYDSSFYQAEIEIYHYLDELEVANIKLVTKGYTRQIDSDDKSVNFSILDATSFFEKEYRNPSGTNFYAQSVFSDLDPRFQGRPIRKVYGLVDGFIPVNIDYVSDSPSTSNNRVWVVGEGSTNYPTFVQGVSASPSSTATRTYIPDTTGYLVGDTVANLSSSQYAIITAVVTNSYIEHTTWSTAATGNGIAKGCIGNVKILQNGRIYTCLYQRDYNVFMDTGNNVFGFEFANNFEATVGLPETLSPNDMVFCRVQGKVNQNTLGGNPFGASSEILGSLSQAVVILYEILKTGVGLSESDLDLTALAALQSSVTDEIGFAIPVTSFEDFPQYKDIILNICQTILAKFFLNFDNEWSLSVAGPIGSTSKTIGDDEILKSSFRYSFSYSDILSRIIVEYMNREVNDLGEQVSSGSVVSQTSEIASNLHQIDRQKTFKSLHLFEAEAQILADRLSYYFGDRRGTCKIQTKNRFFDTELSDNIEVSREKLAGSEFELGTERQRNFAVLSTDKSLNNVSLELDDQKGIEDNSSDW